MCLLHTIVVLLFVEFSVGVLDSSQLFGQWFGDTDSVDLGNCAARGFGKKTLGEPLAKVMEGNGGKCCFPRCCQFAADYWEQKGATSILLGNRLIGKSTEPFPWPPWSCHQTGGHLHNVFLWTSGYAYVWWDTCVMNQIPLFFQSCANLFF